MKIFTLDYDQQNFKRKSLEELVLTFIQLTQRFPTKSHSGEYTQPGLRRSPQDILEFCLPFYPNETIESILKILLTLSEQGTLTGHYCYTTNRLVFRPLDGRFTYYHPPHIYKNFYVGRYCFWRGSNHESNYQIAMELLRKVSGDDGYQITE